jgi:hypothetical protein
MHPDVGRDASRFGQIALPTGVVPFSARGDVGEVKVNPTLLEMERSSLDLIYAGTDGRTLM